MAMIKDEGTASYHLTSVLGSDQRDFLVRSNDDRVKISSLIGKTVGLYFSGSWCPPCFRFTPKLVQAYEQLSEKSDFEVVFISSDRDEESYSGYFGKMPWLAVPFSDSDEREKLKELFDVKGIPHLVIFDKNGSVLTRKGDNIIYDFGADGYPFTPERINQLKEEEELGKRNQSLRSLLVNISRDYLISNNGSKVSVEELEGKTVGLYFSLNSSRWCMYFTDMLIEAYNKLRANGENFEIVLVCSDDEMQDFSDGFKKMPWLALPFKDKNCDELVRYFHIRGDYPSLVIIGPDGKTVLPRAVELVEEHGAEGYPFTPQKLTEVAETKAASQTLESVLISGDHDFVIGKEGLKVPVSDLVGKHVLLYFSAHWCPPCREFTPKLVEAYNEIKPKVEAFEIIYIPSDGDQSSFNEYYSTMPWLALPYGDERKQALMRYFKVREIPKLVALGPNGKTVSYETRELVEKHGARAYPFTKERVVEIEAEDEEMAKKEGLKCDGDVCYRG